MTMQWFTPRVGHFVSKSADGYYAVAPDRGLYEAFHIEAVWAKPASIGGAGTIKAAQSICEDHAARPRRPNNQETASERTS